MTQQKGVNAKVAIGEESAYGTVATVGFILPINSSTLKGTQGLDTAKTLTGNRNPVAPFAKNRDVAGDIVAPVDSLAMPYWLQKMFGDSTVTGVGPYVHEWKIGNTMPSTTIENQFLDLATDAYVRFLGCRPSAWSMEVGGDDELVSTISWLGKSESNETSSFDAAPTTVSLARLNNFEAALLEGGATLSNAKTLSFNIDFGLDTDQYVIGSGGARGDLPEGIVAVTGNLKTLFEDVSLLNKAINGTESSLKLTITGSASSVFEVEFEEIRYARNSPDIPGPQGLMVDLNFIGFYTNGTEASSAVVRVTNSIAIY